MTRINCIPPAELSGKHLVAEYRELPRVFALARECPDAPKSYVLGSGHVKFFYDKLAYLYNRQCDLVAEMLKRGYKPKFDPSGLKVEFADKVGLWNDWQPTQEAIRINKERIKERNGRNIT